METSRTWGEGWIPRATKSKSTVSRWVSAAVQEVGDDTRRRLRERLALSADSAESVARMVGSQLELSLSRLLAAGDAPDPSKQAR